MDVLEGECVLPKFLPYVGAGVSRIKAEKGGQLVQVRVASANGQGCDPGGPVGGGTPRTQTDPTLAQGACCQGRATGPHQLQERQVALDIARREDDCRKEGRALTVLAEEAPRRLRLPHCMALTPPGRGGVGEQAPLGEGGEAGTARGKELLCPRLAPRAVGVSSHFKDGHTELWGSRTPGACGKSTRDSLPGPECSWLRSYCCIWWSKPGNQVTECGQDLGEDCPAHRRRTMCCCGEPHQWLGPGLGGRA